MEGAREELSFRNENFREALRDSQNWEGLWKLTMKEKKESRESFTIQVHNLRELLKESQARAAKEQHLKEEALRHSRGNPMDRRNTRLDLEISRVRGQQWKDIYEDLKKQSLEWEGEFQRLNDIILSDQGTIEQLQAEYTKYNGKFSDLVEFSNGLVHDMPYLLRYSWDELDDEVTPPNIYRFVLACRDMMRKFKANLKVLREARADNAA